MSSNKSASTSVGKKTAEKTPAASKVTARDILHMFLERWWVGLIVGVIAAAALMIWQPKREVLYKTEVSLLFEPRKDRVLNIQEVVETGLAGAGQLNTHMEQLRSKTFFEFVYASFTPEELKRIQDAYRDPANPEEVAPSAAAIIRSGVNVSARRNTTIVVISVTNRNPDHAVLIANRYARRYIDYNLDRANTGTNSAIVFLRNQAEEMRAQVEAAENSLQAYRAKHNVAALGENQNVVMQKLSALGSALVRAQMEQVELRAVLDKVEEYRRDGRDMLEISQIRNYGQVAAARSSLTSLHSQRLLLEERYLPLHPRMKENEIQTQENKRLLEQSVDMAVADIETRFRIAAHHEQRLRKELEIADSQAHELDRISVDYRFLEQEAATKRNTYIRIMDRLNEANVASQLENTNIKIFDPAQVPNEPLTPGAKEMGVKAASLGIALLFFVPIGLGFMDSRLKTAGQVEVGLGETLLGAVKRIKGLGETERAHAFRLRKDDSLAEAYRGIYSEIDIRSLIPTPKVIMITSTLPGDGKSLTATNLASVFAAHGRRTLLIDCDIRRPTLHRYCGVDGRAGWMPWLKLPAVDGERVLPKTIPITENLDLLTSGGASPDPTETINRFVSSGLIKRLLTHYELIILDTPPAAVFPDALLLSRTSDEMIYVCKAGGARLNMVRKTIARLKEAGTPLLGLVLNQIPERNLQGYHGYGVYNSSYYRAYAKQEPAA